MSKIEACGQRSSASKRITDAGDAEALLDFFTKSRNLRLTDVQKNIVRPGLDDVVRESVHDKSWWEIKLGLRKSLSPERHNLDGDGPAPYGGSAPHGGSAPWGGSAPRGGSASRGGFAYANSAPHAGSSPHVASTPRGGSQSSGLNSRDDASTIRQRRHGTESSRPSEQRKSQESSESRGNVASRATPRATLQPIKEQKSERRGKDGGPREGNENNRYTDPSRDRGSGSGKHPLQAIVSNQEKVSNKLRQPHKEKNPASLKDGREHRNPSNNLDARQSGKKSGAGLASGLKQMSIS